MKLRFNIVTALLLLAVLTGCHEVPVASSAKGDGLVHKELAEIDSLMWQRPDSAFSRMLRFAESADTDSMDAFDIHYFHLLLSELLFKNDYAQTNRAELLQAVHYFDSIVGTRDTDTSEGVIR